MSSFPLTIEMMKKIQANQIKKSRRKEDRGMEGCREEAWLNNIIDRVEYDEEMANDVIKQAAYALRTIAVEHPFKQANKRSAWVIAKTILKLNGKTMKVEDLEGEQFMLDVTQGKYSINDIEQWIKNHM